MPAVGGEIELQKYHLCAISFLLQDANMNLQTKLMAMRVKQFKYLVPIIADGHSNAYFSYIRTEV